jgi:integrase
LGVYYRKFRKSGRKIWWISYTFSGRQIFESSHSTSKRFAEKLLAIRRAEVAESRYNLVQTNPPRLKDWAERYLESVPHPSTRKRYSCSKQNLLAFFGDVSQLSSISVARINEFKRRRLNDGVKAATLNRDLRFLSQILKEAERERFLARSPFDLAKFFKNELSDRRPPHILSEREEVKLLAVCSPRLTLLVTLGVETGMRTGEMLALKWEDIDFAASVIQVSKSKTRAGIRAIPLSRRCIAELLRWRSLVGPEYSEWVFPNFSNRRHKLLQAGRKAWASTLKKAGLTFFPIYNLRHTFASRMTAAGVAAVTVAALLGHSSTSIVPRYAQVLDQNRIDAVKKLESLRQSTVSEEPTSQTVNPETSAARNTHN